MNVSWALWPNWWVLCLSRGGFGAGWLPVQLCRDRETLPAAGALQRQVRRVQRVYLFYLIFGFSVFVCVFAIQQPDATKAKCFITGCKVTFFVFIQSEFSWTIMTLFVCVCVAAMQSSCGDWPGLLGTCPSCPTSRPGGRSSSRLRPLSTPKRPWRKMTCALQLTRWDCDFSEANSTLTACWLRVLTGFFFFSSARHAVVRRMSQRRRGLWGCQG